MSKKYTCTIDFVIEADNPHHAASRRAALIDLLDYEVPLWASLKDSPTEIEEDNEDSTA
jgi:hypothetical protein